MNHVVVFDGTSNRPWGRYIDVEAEILAEALKQYEDATRRP